MIPYFSFPKLQLGPFTLEIFGVFVAAGILWAAHLIAREAEREGLDPQPMRDYALWGVVAGLLAGHWLHLFGYHPEELQKSPFQVFKFWDGLSSFGGLLGGILAALVFFRIRKVPFGRYADALALGVAPGWAVARLGCFAVHDHPGVLTDFFLAVQFPVDRYGGSRHDLGMYDALWLFVCSGILYALRRKGLLRGRLLPLLALLYAPARILFDALRARPDAWLDYVDKRYFGVFTPAQLLSFTLLVYAAWGLFTVGHTKVVGPPAPAPGAPRVKGAKRA